MPGIKKTGGSTGSGKAEAAADFWRVDTEPGKPQGDDQKGGTSQFDTVGYDLQNQVLRPSENNSASKEDVGQDRPVIYLIILNYYRSINIQSGQKRPSLPLHQPTGLHLAE